MHSHKKVVHFATLLQYNKPEWQKGIINRPKRKVYLHLAFTTLDLVCNQSERLLMKLLPRIRPSPEKAANTQQYRECKPLGAPIHS